jgi:hypothetical protein
MNSDPTDTIRVICPRTPTHIAAHGSTRAYVFIFGLYRGYNLNFGNVDSATTRGPASGQAIHSSRPIECKVQSAVICLVSPLFLSPLLSRVPIPPEHQLGL